MAHHSPCCHKSNGNAVNFSAQPVQTSSIIIKVVFFVCVILLRPAERVKNAEKQGDTEDVEMAQKHTETMQGWGDLCVYQGCVDTVTKFLGTEVSADRKRAKVVKDLKHLVM